MDQIQREINDAEWSNPDNWRALVYFSKRDSRIVVPLLRRDAYLGQVTINLGHRWGCVWLVVIAVTALATVALL